MIFALVLYAALHDVTKLYVFQNAGDNSLFAWYRKTQGSVFLHLKKIPAFYFIKNHLVDFLWFLSFSLVFTSLFPAPKIVQFIFLILMASLSEFSQLFFANLGTFDIFDLIGYVCIALIFLFFQISPRK